MTIPVMCFQKMLTRELSGTAALIIFSNLPLNQKDQITLTTAYDVLIKVSQETVAPRREHEAK